MFTYNVIDSYSDKSSSVNNYENLIQYSQVKNESKYTKSRVPIACIGQGRDLRYVQPLLEHSSPRITQVYTHITTKGFENIVSPLDEIDT